MCGIFSLLNDSYQIKQQFIEEQFNKGKNRGPEFSKLQKINVGTLFGFHRLAINGLNDVSNQPIIIGDVALICNGEIYNYKELYNLMNVTPYTDSDCEVIIHLYRKYGIEQTLQMLDGVFSFILCDYNINLKDSILYVARDPFGVRPLYYLKPINNDEMVQIQKKSLKQQQYTQDIVYAFASELKVLIDYCSILDNYTIENFKPGTYSTYKMKYSVNPKWILDTENVFYHTTGFQSTLYYNDIKGIIENIHYYLINAVKKRVLVTDRPIACLLSGGLDSSLITALVNDVYKTKSSTPLETYSIGLEGSEDLKYAKIVADYLGTKHTEIILSEKDFIDAIPEVIYTIESYDTTTVRASIGNYLLGKYISKNSDAKVIFNGDGSDELCGGYLYMHKAPDPLEFDRESRRLLKDINMFDVLRSDKCISSHGLEPRTPFLDRSWVQCYLSIHPKLRFHPGQQKCEKFLIRSAFSQENYLTSDNKPLLPECILWRTKEAFSDGVSKTTRSLYEIIQEHVNNELIKSEITNLEKEKEQIKHNYPDTPEKYYYRSIFESHYKNMGHLIPYFWMPKYVDAKDASARTLNIYNDYTKNN